MEKIYRVQMNSKGMPNFATAVEIADRPQGEWIIRPKGFGIEAKICSVCGTEKNSMSNYCPNCGAKMGGERKDDE